MSKAFTRESDDDDFEEMPMALPSSTLPFGAKNYMTSDGAERIRAEIERLVQVEHPRLAAEKEEIAKRKLQRLEQRIRLLEESLRSAVITPPPRDIDSRREVRFGATVTVRRRSGDVTYRIVGVDEADPDEGSVSWPSPIAKALMGATVGQKVRFKFPSGEEDLEVIAIAYP